jgi:predicted ATPase/DNA-binding SARP family transcriptional activator
MVNLSLLGPFQADLDGQPVHGFKAQKAKALLIFLAVESNRAHQRESLMTMLWPGFALQSAQQNLRQTLYLLRQSLPIKENAPDLFLVDRTTVSWNPDVPLSLDIAQFEELAASLEIIDRRRAADLYRGPFLEDFYLPDSEPFEEWVTSKRAYYFNAVQDLIGHLADDYIAAADWHAAEEITRRLLEFDKLQEPAHRQLIEVLARSGRRQDALRQFNTLRQLLKEELDLDPDSETISLIEAIRAGTLKEITPKKAPEVPTPVETTQIQPNHNLPHSLANFIGRQQELGDIQRFILNNRLVMLTGTSGIGKTNLCLKTGHNLIDAFPDGVWMVELAPVTDPAFIPQAAAAAMGLNLSSGRPAEEVLMDVLHDSHSLLILDNCEHLIEDAARFAENILHTAPGVKILASSLEPFEIHGEIQYPVPPLTNPDEPASSPLEGWQQFDALHLFVTRAQAVSPDFEITEENISAVVQICRQLDGIPLAIELAAARVNVLPVADIAARLDDRFNLLVGGSRTAMPRHQTLRGMMEWSWELLSQPEKDLLQRLSVFAGGMTLEAVEGICSGDGIDPSSLLELLAQLVKKSFVVTKHRSGKLARYHLLESIRQYGVEQLRATSKLAYYRQRHLAYFVQLAVEAEPKLVSPEQGIWIRRLRSELDNLRAALLWARETDALAGIKLITAMWHFWDYGHKIEGQAWLTQLLDQAEKTLPPGQKAKAHWVLSRFNIWPVENKFAASRFAEESLSIYQDLDDQEGIANCLSVIGWSLYYDDPKKYLGLLQQSVDIFKSIGNQLGLAEILFWLGFIHEDTGFEDANAYYQESLVLFREVGHLLGIVAVLENSARLSIFQGHYDAARLMLEESLSLHQELGDTGGSTSYAILGYLYLNTAEYPSAQKNLEKSIHLGKQNGALALCDWSRAHLGYVYLRTDDLDQAQDSFENIISSFYEADTLIGIIYAVEGLASLSVARKQPKKAAKLFGWADRMREEINSLRWPAEDKNVDMDKSVIIELIGEEAYNAAYTEGQSLSTEQAIALAKSDS